MADPPQKHLYEPMSSSVSDGHQSLAPGFSFRTFAYRESLFQDFEALAAQGWKCDGLIIDLTQIGYTLPFESVVRMHTYARRLLKPVGVLILVKKDGAITLSRDIPSGGLTFNVYDSPFAVFARYPMVADYMCATISGIDRRRLRGAGSTLANHILHSTIPVLTEEGRMAVEQCEIPPPQNWLVQLVDDYSSIEFICRTMEKDYDVPQDVCLRIFHELESDRLIFPIFSRIQFLSNCYHNRKSFRLGRYMVAAGIITESELQELLEVQQDEGWGRNQKTFLGLIAVRQGYLNTRELEVLLHDQYLYGGYHKVADSEPDNLAKNKSVETIRDSMIGSLGAIDSAGLLQSLASAKKTGLLTVENRDKVVMVAFKEGKPTHAKIDSLAGYVAIVEFLVTWEEGIFVFRDKTDSKELNDECRIEETLDRILLDSALFQDQTRQVFSTLQGGRNAILERFWNLDSVWPKVSQRQLTYFDGSEVLPEEKKQIYAVSQLLDGLTTIEEAMASCPFLPTHSFTRHIRLLIDLELVKSQQTSLFRPLTVFQNIAAELKDSLGGKNNKTLLESSLHYVHGSSSASQRFNIDQDGHVSVNLSQVKKSGVPIPAVLLELRRWMEAYLSYARREVEPSRVNEVVAKVVRASQL